MKKQNKPLTAAEEYPELFGYAENLAKNIAHRINTEVNDLNNIALNKCPYPRQCTLEMLIKILEDAV